MYCIRTEKNPKTILPTFRMNSDFHFQEQTVFLQPVKEIFFRIPRVQNNSFLVLSIIYLINIHITEQNKKNYGLTSLETTLSH